MNLSTLSNAWSVFRAGEAVANPAAWKRGQVTANMVTLALAAVVALLKGLGYDLHLDDATLAAVGTGLFALVNWLLTVVTTDKIGITGKPTKPEAGPAGDVPASQQGTRPDAPRSEPADTRAADPVRGNAQTTGPTGDFMP